MTKPHRPPLTEPPIPLREWCYRAHGASGLVYDARDERGDALVVKELFPLGARRGEDHSILLPRHLREQGPARFLKEALTLNAVNDPNVPRFRRHFEKLGNHYILLGRIEGMPLDRWLASRFGRRRDAQVGRAIADGFAGLLGTLCRLAAKGIVHGDIAPANIIARPDGSLAIVDFGSAFSSVDPHLEPQPGHPGFRPSVTAGRLVELKSLLDLFGLCSSFYALMAGVPPVAADGTYRAPLGSRPEVRIAGSEAVAQAIDHVLQAFAKDVVDDALLSTAGAMFGLRFDIIPTPPPVTPVATWKKAPEALPMTLRYQSCLLQSFDTPRFREDEWLRRRNGEAFIVSPVQKLALARAEALLNICFGREIIVPAGQVADSPGFEALFNEIQAAWQPRRHAIDLACERNGMPHWRPFRLALERPELRNYSGFTQSYNYTGAEMVLLRINGGDEDREQGTRALLGEATRLFNLQQFDALGALMETKARRTGFGDFARKVYHYFDDEVSVFADPGVPEVGTSAYAELFSARLGADEVHGIDPQEVGLIKDVVEQIESDLKQHGFEGYRGNWYTYGKKFAGSWPLARAYLDFRLYMNLGRIYRVDHPILVTQPIEADRYDHSVMLGPHFAGSGNELRDVRLLRLAGTLADRIDWDAVFEMFLDDRFLDNVSTMNNLYFSRDQGTAAKYQNWVQAHGRYLGKEASHFLDIDEGDGTLSPRAVRGASNQIVQASEAVMRWNHDFGEAAKVHESMTYGMRDVDPAFASAAIAPLNAQGAFNLGGEMADQLLHYYLKPYRTAVSLGV